MEHYAGLDVSLELTSVCVVDAQGEIVREDLLDVLELVRRAAVKVRTPREELRPCGGFLTVGGFLPIVRELGERELHVVGRQVAVRAIVEVLDGFGSTARLSKSALSAIIERCKPACEI